MIIPEHLEATVVDLIAWCFYPRIIYVVINGKTPWRWFARPSVVRAAVLSPPLSERRRN